MVLPPLCRPFQGAYRQRRTSLSDEAAGLRATLRARYPKYASLSEAAATERAQTIWAEINEPNLERNIRPTRGRATLVLRKGPDHSVTAIRLRKV